MQTFAAASLRGLVVFFALFLLFSIARAQVMQSSNYRIQSDSLNFGGGLSTSSSYTLESTAGEIATGDSNSTNYNLHAGYQQMQQVYIALTGASDIVMSPSLGGISGGTSDGSTTVTVTTDSASGYELTLEASQSPAMQEDGGSNTIADYVPSGAVPDFSFSTGATDSHFGYSPEGADVATRFKDNTSACGGGSFDTALKCWDGPSTTPVVIATSGSANQPDGATTTIRFRVGIGGSVNQAPGTYTATTTLTALPL